MSSALLAPGSREFLDLFDSFAYSAYRLETLQCYGSSGEDSAFAAFLAGQPYLRHPGKEAWLSTIRAARENRRWMGRVHVAIEPLSDYMAFELTWAYAPNVAQGEDIRILPVPDVRWPSNLPHEDYWLFDSSQLYHMRYADNSGTWLGAEHITNPERVVEACRGRDAAWSQSLPWSEYVGTRPELASRLPEPS
ncbi:MAG: DUF6879 family protein [Sciscionella sp.]